MLPTDISHKGHFAMFRTLLKADKFMDVSYDSAANKLTASIDRSKILTHGRPVLSSLLLQLHIYRCIADIKACRAFMRISHGSTKHSWNGDGLRSKIKAQADICAG